jgi:hypothetical protein
MGILLLSGDTTKLTEWNFDDIVHINKQSPIDRLIQYEEDNTIGPYCNGLTYLEIEQLDKRFNN